MGFFEGFGRLLAGKPVFENPDDPEPEDGDSDGLENEYPTQPTVAPAGNPLRDANGRKVIPDIKIEHVKSSRNGTTMTVEAWVTNHSDLAIRLDDWHILGQRTQLHHELSPGQCHQMILYRGSVAPSEHDNRSKLTFRILANTDEFEINYRIEFYRTSDGVYMIEEFHPEGETRDI